MIDSEKRMMVISRDNGRCRKCGKIASEGWPQVAHIVAKTKPNLAIWGQEVIDHEDNLALTCGLKCNAAMMKGFKPNTLPGKAHLEAIKKKVDKSQKV